MVVGVREMLLAVLAVVVVAVFVVVVVVVTGYNLRDLWHGQSNLFRGIFNCVLTFLRGRAAQLMDKLRNRRS